MVAVLFIVFLGALAIGVPVAFSLGLASVAYMLGAHIQMINFAQYFFKGLDSFTLLCIPGFTFAGKVIALYIVEGFAPETVMLCVAYGLCRHLRHGSVRYRRTGRR